MSGRGRRRPPARVRLWVAAAVLGGAALASAETPISLAPESWDAAPADGVELSLAAAPGPRGRPALRLDYDFQGRGGWAAARHELDLELPESYEIRFTLRGEAAGRSVPPNHLEVKLVGPSGDDVWWYVERDLRWPAEWTPVRVRKRQIEYAWGPLGAQRGAGGPRRVGALEIAVTAGGGGSGSLWIADLAVVPTEPPRPPEGPPRALASSSAPGHPPAAVLDGDRGTAWLPAAGAAPPALLTVDLRGLVELGGLSLYWRAGGAPDRFAVELSTDGESWDPVRREVPAGAPESHLRLPETEARLLRVRLDAGVCPRGCGVAELVVRPLAFGASANVFFETLAREAPRGAYPRGFSGEAVYWTVVGADGAAEEALFSEDGALEVGETGFSLEPFVLLQGSGLWSWAEASAAPSPPQRSLAEGDLPLPTVVWRLPGAGLEITALTAGGDGGTLSARYRVSNRGTERLRGALFVAARPFQVNPPYQFLNVAGGVAPIHSVRCLADGLRVTREAAGGGDGEEVRVWASPPPAGCGARVSAARRLTDVLAAGGVPPEPAAADPAGAASAALAWELDLGPGETATTVVAVPLAPGAAASAAALAGGGTAAFAAAEAAERRRWRAALGPLELELPPAAGQLVRTLRSSLAWILIHRDGPALQPGSRAYARSWIRDGALTGSALLRLGHAGAARRFATWFAGFQYPDGKVPCCVDRRGADPVPEHDSHGQLIHLVTEVYRYTGDRDFAERLFPHVVAAADHIENLRQQRRGAEYRQPPRQVFFGLLPESISHEGYAAKPVHSYWDDVFAYRGLDDAAALAAALGRPELASTWAARRDELRADLLASMQRVRQRDGLAYLPASAELGDFDSTSTTAALDPGGLGPHLPAAALEATFERFWQGFAARRAGGAAWDAYTPYEIRHAGAFLRLGWTERAHELLTWYLDDHRPPAWNGWPEVVTRDPREPRFLGDLPHGWVASDFIRSALDLFAYEERERRALVLAAGVPAAWLDTPRGIAVRHLATPWGELSYRLERRGDGVRYRLEPPGREAPPGGLVLTWPLAGAPGRALVDGRAVEPAADGRLVVAGWPRTVDLLPAATRDDDHTPRPEEER